MQRIMSAFGHVGSYGKTKTDSLCCICFAIFIGCTGCTYSNSKDSGAINFDAPIIAVSKNAIKTTDAIYYIDAQSASKEIEIQNGDSTCWASCLQYLIKHENSGSKISQRDIISKIKPELTDYNSYEGAVSLLGTIDALGYGNFSVSPGHTRHLLEGLDADKPILMSYYISKGMAHDVIVYKVHYIELGFGCDLIAYLPSGLITCYRIIDFEVLDPADGQLKTIQAAEIENKINYFISKSIR